MVKLSFSANTYVKALITSSLASAIIYWVGSQAYDDYYLGFMNWNLFLAWLPLLFAWLLERHLQHESWVSWQGIAFSFLWLGFLPNSFYIASDLVHIRGTTADIALFYVVTLASFTISGLLLGYSSLYVVHRQLLKRFRVQTAHLLVSAVLLLSSFAIYLGRYLRWNTWDVLINPAGLIFDVSDRFANPTAHSRTFQVTLLFFSLLGSLYMIIWQVLESVRPTRR
ncbi:MAG: DUF1361 domain-containing protein [Candidatus Saccharibacteria bacterium]|nr:DUF1361 domain-containing protein [Candidatus Saccharibacteria bacterium]